MEKIMVDVLTLNYNDKETTLCFLRQIESYKNIRKILVVDNASTDDSFEYLSKINSNRIKVISCRNNGGYGAGNNFGLKYLNSQYHSKYVLQCNPDVIISEDTISKMESFLLKYSSYMMVAPFMLNAKREKLPNTAFKIPSLHQYILGFEIFFSKFCDLNSYHDIIHDNSLVKDVDALSGSLFMVDLPRMIKYGMYDENVFLYCEEVILAMRLKKNRQKVALLPQEFFIHNHSVSISKTYASSTKRHRLLLKSKLYVIKKYLKANRLEYFIAQIMAVISLIENYLNDLRKNVI